MYTNLCMIPCVSSAYRQREGSGGISHATARAMLHDDALVDLGAQDFMRSLAGLGETCI